ncbi:MAG: zinc-binding dehydrogenase, partial [Spirochaetia bacterium]
TSGAQVIVVDPIESRRKRSLKYGANEAIDPADGTLVDHIMDLTAGEGASVCVEASGNDKAIASLYDVSGHSARIRLIGHSIGRKVPVEIGKTIWKTLSITGSGGTKNFGQRTIRFMSAIRDKYDFSALNTHFFPFSDLHKAFDVAIHNKEEALKVMLKF